MEGELCLKGLCVQGPVAVGLKAENRLKLHKKAKLVSTLGRMTCKTRMGRENATAGQAELKLRLGDDQRSQVGALPLNFWLFTLFHRTTMLLILLKSGADYIGWCAVPAGFATMSA